MTELRDEAMAVYAAADCLFGRQKVEMAFDRMAQHITEELEGSNPVVLCVLNGGVVPTGSLLPRLDFPLELDYLHATRYRGKTQGMAHIQWLARPTVSLKGRTVLLIDDILDEGITLAEIVRDCHAQGAENVFIAVLLQKMHDRGCGLDAHFVGLEVEDRYVFGYGMDYKGYLRNAPGIFAVAGS